MNTQEQAYIEGFVKRAAEYGFDEDEAMDLLKTAISKAEMNDLKASVPINTLFGPSMLGVMGSSIKDLQTPNYVPSRLLNINAPAVLSSIGGALLGTGASDMLNADDQTKFLAMLAGGQLGGMTGGYLGTKHYNDKIDQQLKDKTIPWEKSERIRLSHF